VKKDVVENIDAISGEVIIGSKLVELIEPDLAFVFPSALSQFTTQVRGLQCG